MMKEVVVFFLAGKEYGVEITNMQGIENYVPMTEVTDSKGKMTGVVSIRGEMIPVIDIRKCLVLPPVPATADTKYVVLRTTHGKAAIAVDGVSQIFRMEGENIRDIPPMFQGNGTGYVDFVIRNGQNLVLVIAPERLLSKPEWESIDEKLNEIQEEKKRREEEEKRLEEEKKREEEKPEEDKNMEEEND